MITALARVIAAPSGSSVAKNYLITDGEYAGCRFAATRDVITPVGAVVAVKFSPDDQFAREVRESDRLQWEVRYAEMPIACNPTKTATVTAPSADEAVEMIQKGIALPIRVVYVGPVAPRVPSFDDCEDAGLDGTLRTHSEPYTWEEVARAALAKIRSKS